jgi:hypothetical protein
MVAVIDNVDPHDGCRHVARAHWILATLYGTIAAVVIRVLYRAIASPGADDSIFGASAALAFVGGWAAIHVTIARGAGRQRRWARTASRVIAFLLFPAVPVGTVFALYMLRNTRPDRWAHRLQDPAGNA